MAPLRIIVVILVALVAAIHMYILWLEMFVWTTRGKRAFKSLPEDLFEKTKTLAANQGLYNGFLAAGLIWSLLIKDELWSRYVAIFFLACVAVAGIYGAATAQKKIFFIQALPALVAMVFVIIA